MEHDRSRPCTRANGSAIDHSEDADAQVIQIHLFSRGRLGVFAD